MSILRLKNLCYRYEDGNKDVLKNINITFKTGKVTGIVGKSGAGKSTLLSLISGLDTSTSGEVLYKDKDINLLIGIYIGQKTLELYFKGIIYYLMRQL